MLSRTLLFILLGLGVLALPAQTSLRVVGGNLSASGDIKIVLKDVSFIQHGTFTPGQSTLILRGESAQTLESLDTLRINRVIIDKSNGDVTLTDTAYVQNAIVFERGNLVGGEIFLGPGAYLSHESDTTRAIDNIIVKDITYPTGQVALADSGNMGFSFTREGQATNRFLVKRFNTAYAQDTTWGGPTVKRYYQIIPQGNVPNGDVRASYLQPELNGIDEANLALIHQYNGAWVSDGSWVLDTVLNEGEKPNALVDGYYAFGNWGNNPLGFSLSGVALSEIGDTIGGVKFDFIDIGATTFDQVLGDSAAEFVFYHSPAINNMLGANIQASKNNDTARTEGVDVADVILITQDILGVNELGSGVKELAGDVSKDLGHNSTDLLLIRYFILGVSNGFPAFNHDTNLETIWDFIPSDQVSSLSATEPSSYTSPRFYANGYQTTATQQDFVGIKLGDVNNSWMVPPPVNKNQTPLYFEMPSMAVTPGETFNMPVHTRAFNDISGYQFTMSWDPNIISFEGVEGGALPAHYGQHKIEEGHLTTVWNDPQGESRELADGTVAFNLTFKAIGPWQAESPIRLHGDLTPAVAYDGLLIPRPIAPTTATILLNTTTNLDGGPNGTALHISPNPFVAQTSISFDLPQAGDVNILIYNNLGQVVKQINQTFSAGKHTLNWDGTHDAGFALSEGFYHLHFLYQGRKQAMTIQKKS